MRIGQISPLSESVPPRCYGGTERVVHYLTEELVRRGHDVVLFASGDSSTSAELFASVPEALRQAGYGGDPLVPELIQVDVVADLWDRFDILHFHTGPSHYPLMSRLPVAHLTTMHGPLDGEVCGRKLPLYKGVEPKVIGAVVQGHAWRCCGPIEGHRCWLASGS